MIKQKDILMKIYSTCSSEDILLQFDSALRAMFYKYMLAVLNRSSNHFNTSKKYMILSNDASTILESFPEDESLEELNFNISNVQDMLNSFNDEKLLLSCKYLTESEKELLFMKYVKQYTDKEIASILSITRQGVTRKKNIILKKILVHYDK